MPNMQGMETHFSEVRYPERNKAIKLCPDCSKRNEMDEIDKTKTSNAELLDSLTDLVGGLNGLDWADDVVNGKISIRVDANVLKNCLKLITKTERVRHEY